MNDYVAGAILVICFIGITLTLVLSEPHTQEQRVARTQRRREYIAECVETCRQAGLQVTHASYGGITAECICGVCGPTQPVGTPMEETDE